MASLPPQATPGGGADAAISALSGGALARLAADAQSNAPTPTPTPEPATTPEPVQTQEVAPPSPETSPTESPSTEGKPALAVTDPAALRFIEMHGGNPSDPSTWEQALAKGMEYNNRLAELSKTPEPVQAEPEPPVEIDAQMVDGYVEKLLAQDAECKSLVQQFNEADNRIKQLQDPNAEGSIQSLKDAIKLAELRLKIPEIANDSFLKSDLADQIRIAQWDVRLKEGELRDLKDDKKRFDADFRAKVDYYKNGVTDRLKEKLTNEREQATYEQEYNKALEETPKLFQAAFDKAVSKHNVGEISKGDFREWIKDQAYRFMATNKIADWEAFVDSRTPKFLEMVDRNHRAKSAEHARAAHERAAQPGPALAPTKPGVAPVVQKMTPQGMESKGLSRLKAMLRGQPSAI